MTRERDIDPVVTTYIKTSTTRSGRRRIHVRIKDPQGRFDRRGTGVSLADAKQRALRDVGKSR